MPKTPARSKATKVAKKKLVGRGDYSQTTLDIKEPMQRLEAKIDHLENKLVGKALSKSNAASTIGRTLGNFVNQGDLGALAGSSIAKMFGHGDYSVHVNSLIKGDVRTGSKFSSDGKRGTRIIEREYVGNVVSGPSGAPSSVFNTQNHILNPTNTSLFPWLSQLAPLYDQWEPNGIVFEFVSTSSEYGGSSQALGAVIMATDYDPYDSGYTTKQQMENSDYSCSTKPSSNLMHGVECDPKERPLNLMYTSTDNGAPKNTYSLGTFTVASQGCAANNATLGELWVSYDITFYKKQLVFDSTTYFSANGVSATGLPMFSGVSVVSSKQMYLTNTSTESIVSLANINPGRYQICMYYATFSTEIYAPTVIGGVLISQRAVISVDGTSLESVFIADVTSANAGFSWPVRAAGTDKWCLSVVPVNAGTFFKTT